MNACPRLHFYTIFFCANVQRKHFCIQLVNSTIKNLHFLYMFNFLVILLSVREKLLAFNFLLTLLSMSFLVFNFLLILLLMRKLFFVHVCIFY